MNKEQCNYCTHANVCYGKANNMRIADKCSFFANMNTTITLPIKVGQTVYVPWKYNNKQGIATVEIEEIKFYDSKNHYMFLIEMDSDDESFNQEYGRWKLGSSIGENIFLTKEDAEIFQRRKSNEDS